MCDFLVGQQYSLSTENGSNKSLLFVKLTDSALHSIENFLQAKVNSIKPTIQFESNNGSITLPLGGQKITYGFTISNLTADGSCFQCLQHTSERSINSLGSMHMKMQIHANEDSYAVTRCKMAAVDQEQKSLCTKEIKPNGTNINRKNRFKHPGGVFTPKLIPFVKAQEEAVFLKPKDKTSSPPLSRESVRKRIIHILAIKPYKKPDILLRLMKEGISNEDKAVVPSILDQVGVCKGIMYTLSSHLWNEVEDNWKFCSKEELKVILRKKQHYFKSKNGIPIPGPQSSVQKVVENKPDLSEPQSKKQRISHYSNHKVTNQNVKASSSKCNSFSKIEPNGFLNGLKVPQLNPVNGHSNGVGETNGKNSKKDLTALLKLCRNDMVKCNGSSPSKDDNGNSISEFHTPDYKQKYHKITSQEQRAQFASDFNSQYAEYLKLHTKMKNISEKLSSLENSLQNCEEGTEEFRTTRREMHKIFKTVQNSQYQKDWKKFNSLLSSLSRIKNIIAEYDNAASKQ